MTDYTYLRQGRRERIVLGKVLGEGAAGRVCAVPVMPGVAAKIYKTAAEAAEYEEKIEVMVATRPNLPDFPGKRFTCRQIAWPLASLHEPRGAFAGFLMPEIDFAHSRPLESILQKNSRKLDNISEQYRLRVLVAANMATVFAELHRLKHYMIDMKPDNLRLYAKAGYLAVVDTDGFSIRGSAKRFPAQQFTDNYIAPEGRGRRPQDMGEDQDRFALAVILFQLLNNGLHPYSGIMSPQSPLPRELQSRIYANLYAYGLRPHPEIQPAPASIHASFDTTTRQMFDRAFLGGGGGRPRAREWRDHLRSLLQDSVMVTCRVNPAEHAHFGNGCGLCALENRMAAAARRPGARKAVPKPPAPPAWTPSAQRPVPGLAPATAAFHQPAAMSYIPAGRAGAGVATAAVQRRPFHDVAMLVIGIIVVLALVRACVGAVGQGAAEAPAATSAGFTVAWFDSAQDYVVTPKQGISTVNLRSGPGGAYSVAGQLVRGAAVTGRGRSFDSSGVPWLSVTAEGGMSGFVAERLLRTVQRSAPPAWRGSEPSFSCAGQLSYVERAVCGDAGLGGKDRSIASAYRALIAETNGGVRADAIAMQRSWLAERDRCGGSGDVTACLHDSYDRRDEQLRASLADARSGSAAKPVENAAPPPPTASAQDEPLREQPVARSAATTPRTGGGRSQRPGHIAAAPIGSITCVLPSGQEARMTAAACRAGAGVIY